MEGWKRWYGKRVKVVSGRKVPVGTEGTVFWYGAGRSYGYSRMIPMRVGLKTDAGETVWVAACHVEEVAPVSTEVDGLARNWGLRGLDKDQILNYTRIVVGRGYEIP